MRRGVRGLMLLGVVGFLSCLVFGRPALATATTQSIAFPMYEYPTIGSLWANVNAAGSQVPFLIVNPASGPGTTEDTTYTSYIAGNTAAGQRSVGYVYSNYQSRAIGEVVTDIDKFYELYPEITGIFVDLVQNGSADDLCYAATTYNYIKSKHPSHLVVMNFGNNVEARYEPYSDIFGNAENFYSNYTSWTPLTDGFENNAANANRFWHMVHTASSGQFANSLALTRTNNAGWVIITDATMPNPYMVTPSYWSTFLTSVATLPQSTVPNRGITSLPANCLDLSLTTSSAATTATKQIDTQITNTVKNTDTSRVSWGGTSVSYSVPAGASLTSLSAGTGWSCSVASSACTYAGNTAANTTLPTIDAVIAASCNFQSGAATVTLHNFAANTAVASVTLTKPDDCVDPTVPTTPTTPTTPVVETPAATTPAAPVAKKKAVVTPAVVTTTTTAPPVEPEPTISSPVTPTPSTAPPVSTQEPTPREQEKQPSETSTMIGIVSWTVITVGVASLGLWGFIAWRRRHNKMTF